MKKLIFFMLLSLCFGMICEAQITVKTPTNVSIVAYDNPEWNAMLATWESEAAAWISDHYSNAVRLAPASYTYNCHDYAWNYSDGGNPDWINKLDGANPNISKYWSGATPTFSSTTSTSGTKVFFPNGDHSLKASSSNPGYYESKWGPWPRYRHSLTDCPYNSSSPGYYKLNITGEDFLCVSGQDTYSTLNISGATYNWSANSLTISGSGYSVTGTGSGGGQGKVMVAITSPYSSTTIHGETPVWIGTPQISNKKVDAYNYYTGIQVCPGNHSLNVTPVGGDAGTATWVVPAGITYLVGENELDFVFPSNVSSVSITASSTNSCGAGSNSAFYLTKKTYGCSKSLEMTIFPNPASDNVTISINSSGSLPNSDSFSSDMTELNYDKAVESTDYTISIFNSQSKLMSKTTRGGKSFSIPLVNLTDGTYILEVNDGKNIVRQQFVIKHK
jgi:hypothetical protein